MRDLGLHLLDIARNSVEAGATVLELEVREDSAANWLAFRITDNGRGMDAATVRQAADPFFSTRKTRKQGLGLSLLKETCRRCGGDLEIASEPGVGTTVHGGMQLMHLDRPPLGHMGGIIQALACEAGHLRLWYRHEVGGREFVLDTEEIRRELDGGAVDEPSVLCWIARTVDECLAELHEF